MRYLVPDDISIILITTISINPIINIENKINDKIDKLSPIKTHANNINKKISIIAQIINPLCLAFFFASL